LEDFETNLAKFLPYLEDLYRRLYNCVLLFAAAFIGGFFATGHIVRTILKIVEVEQVVVATTSPFQFAEIAVDTGFLVALICTIPYLVYSLYVFISPALTRREKRYLFQSVPVGIGLFALGFSYGSFILYYAFGVLAAINTDLGIQNVWNVTKFFSQMFTTAALLGFVFQYPLVLSVCIRIGVLDRQVLIEKRQLAYIGIFVAVSLLPPTDGISLIAMALPLMLLYEATILVNKRAHHVRTRN
jgi:sec-independent protein translocase protein TatC